MYISKRNWGTKKNAAQKVEKKRWCDGRRFPFEQLRLNSDRIHLQRIVFFLAPRERVSSRIGPLFQTSWNESSVGTCGQRHRVRIKGDCNCVRRPEQLCPLQSGRINRRNQSPRQRRRRFYRRAIALLTPEEAKVDKLSLTIQCVSYPIPMWYLNIFSSWSERC